MTVWTLEFVQINSDGSRTRSVKGFYATKKRAEKAKAICEDGFTSYFEINEHEIEN